jgi:hypothetical protein
LAQLRKFGNFKIQSGRRRKHPRQRPAHSITVELPISDRFRQIALEKGVTISALLDAIVRKHAPGAALARPCPGA